MIKIGVTGGIGSGKSVVCEVLRLHDIPVYDADKEAKILNDNSPIIREKLSKHFGKDLYAEGKLNKKKLTEIIFGNEGNLKIANSIIHPELAKHFLSWVQQQNPSPVVAIDAAVLFEAGFQKYLDYTITVTAPTEIRMERVMKRDNFPKEKIEARIKSQLSDEEKIKLSDFVIINDNCRSLLAQINEIFKSININ